MKRRDHWPYRTELIAAAKEFAIYMVFAAIAGALVGIGIAWIFVSYGLDLR